MSLDDSFESYRSERDFLKNYASQIGHKASKADSGYFEPGFYKKLREESRKWHEVLRDYSNAAILVPVGLWSMSEAFTWPDSDISLLGIGNHRFFLFHSGAAAWVIKRIYEANFGSQQKEEPFGTRVWRKVFGVASATSVFAIGCHLTIDVFQPKSVIFPGIGSLIDGTLVDDNIWLFGNALYCFKIADDLYSLALGDDYKRVKLFVKERFLIPLKEGGARGVPSWD